MMILLYILILLLSLYGIRVKKDGFYTDYIGKQQCDAIKGIFIIVVFSRHLWPYMVEAGYTVSNTGDVLFTLLNSCIHQLLVVMFLFYSGYGVMESIGKKGSVYVNSIPKKRILATLLNFDIAVLVFLLLDILICKKLNMTDILLAFTGWTSLGNSNWYIFVILVCYLITWIGFSKNWGGYYYRVTYLLILFFAFFIALRFTKGAYWYDTLFAYPSGMLYSQYKKKIESIVHKKYTLYLILSLSVFIMTYIWAYILPGDIIKGTKCNITSIALATTIVIMTMKLKIGNKSLYWLGANLFPLYIYQRIPMIVLSQPSLGNLPENMPLLYIVSCMLITLFIAKCYRYWQIKL